MLAHRDDPVPSRHIPPVQSLGPVQTAPSASFATHVFEVEHLSVDSHGAAALQASVALPSASQCELDPQ
jgi:hypothetical protein